MDTRGVSWSNVAAVSTAAVAVAALYRAATASKTLTELAPPRRGVEDLIGNTPVIKIKSLSKATGCEVYAKMELCNPGGSAKDRVALGIVRAAERQGLLRPGFPDVVFEGTSGSTGISIATICNALGYRAHISLPDDTSAEKLALLESLGAQINKVRPAGIVDPEQYVNAAQRACNQLNQSGDGSHRGVFADQFENDANWRVHYQGTGPEIYRQLDGRIDAFIAGCGTGGTIAGVARFLKEKLGGRLRVVLADPQGSGFYNRVKFGVMYDRVEQEGTRRRHQVDTIVEGIGLNRITHNFSQGEPYIDDAERVTDGQAVRMAKFLSVNDGLFIGSSTAINAVAAVKVAESLPPGSRIVIIACDSGSRHLSKFWKEALCVDNETTLREVLAGSQ
ncbi:putative cysteine synthase [Lachancea thermotolerans CBS 6340]|uniref:cysteine synthase n=1 Tax=Lachancea thermotolerans (strain ATCC 56472 / CBS 6340 / NRRL Y-8284) TaxID=559295 RepID=C5DI11_LACTC|nr:KLTH0E08800p [Lachancea thermotolerans CBS 6340]CAR23422.1 KLTH0E08800p [Lachancea thermotolerans CBS 6340]